MTSTLSKILLCVAILLTTQQALAEQAMYNGREVTVQESCFGPLPAGQCAIPVGVENGVASWVPSSGLCAIVPCSEAPHFAPNVRVL